MVLALEGLLVVTLGPVSEGQPAHMGNLERADGGLGCSVHSSRMTNRV